MKTDLLNEDTPCLSIEEAYRYTHGLSTDGERVRVERHITTCDLCFDALEGARKIAHSDEAVERVHAIRQDVLKSLRDEKKIVRLTPLWARVLAAAAAIAIVFSTVVLMNRQPHVILAYEFFKPLPNSIPITRGQAGTLEDAMAYYEIGDFKSATTLLSEYVSTNPNDSKATLYLAVSWLACEEPKRAISLLKSGKLDDPLFVDYQWYLTLAYLAASEAAQAENVISSGVFDGSAYSQQAKQLRVELQ